MVMQILNGRAACWATGEKGMSLRCKVRLGHVGIAQGIEYTRNVKHFE